MVAARSRQSSKFLQSPFLNEFDSCDKGKKRISYKFRQKHSFDGFGIYYNPPFDLLTEYRIWVEKGLLRIHAKKYVS